MITPGAANGGSEQQTRRGGMLFSPEFMLNNQFTEHCFSLQAEGQAPILFSSSRFVAIESGARPPVPLVRVFSRLE